MRWKSSLSCEKSEHTIDTGIGNLTKLKYESFDK